MGDRIALLKDGLLQQCATPREIYDRPANLFVAGFIGSPAMNLVSVPVTESGVKFGNHTSMSPAVTSPVRAARSSSASVPRTSRSPRTPTVSELVIDVVEELGADAYIYGTPTDKSIAIEGSGDDALAKPLHRPRRRPSGPGEGLQVFVHPKAAHLHVFNKETGERLTS